MKSPQKVAKPMTTAKILREVEKLGPDVQAAYNHELERLIARYHLCEDDSQELLAAFLFAYSAMSNWIAQKHNIKQ